MTPSQPKPSLFSVWRIYRRFWPHVTPDIGYVALDYLTILFAIITNAIMIWLMGMPFNLLQQGQFIEVTTILLIFGGIALFNQSMQYVGGMLTAWIGLRAIGRIRNALVEQLLTLSFPGTSQFSKGDLLARLSGDVDQLKGCVVDAPIFMVSHILTLVLYVGLLFWIDSRLALLALLIVPLYVIHQRLFAERKRRASEIFLQQNGKLLGFEEETLSNMRSISTFCAEGFITRLHSKVFEVARYWAMRNRKLDMAFSVGFSLLIYFTGLVIVLAGIDGIRSDRFGAGHLVSFLLYLGYLTVPVRGVADIFFQCSGTLGAAHRLLEVVDMPVGVPDIPDAPALKITQGAIALRDITFGYSHPKPLFHHLDLRITGGETVALVGPSGSGKSTLAMLLLRFFDVQEGVIEIDGQDIRSVSLFSLRQAMAIVWQEPFLISGTIRENLLMVRPDADEQLLWNACEFSYASEFIQGLPEKLDTPIGVGAMILSVGQKQRLALAQAFVRDASILILDEATSALDSHSEQQVVEALNHLREHRTTLIIAHRYSSLKTAHRVIYFNSDGTVTVGTHEELMEKHAGYRSAVEWQTGKQV